MSNTTLILSGSSKSTVSLGSSISYNIQNTKNRKLFYRKVGSSLNTAFIRKNRSMSFYGDYEFWYPDANDQESFSIFVNRDTLLNVTLSYGEAASRGKIIGARVGQAVGNMENITVPVSGWDLSELGVAIIPTPDIANGETMAFKSSSPEDNPAGDGAREVTIKYIDPITKQLTEIILPTDGTTETVISVPISFNADFYVSKNGIVDGEFTTALGDIILYRQSEPARVYNIIKALGNKSFTLSRLIPDDKDFYISSYVLSGNTKGVSVRLRATMGDDGVLTDGWLFKMPLTIGDTAIPIMIDPPIRVPAGARFKITTYGATNAVDVSAFVNGILEPKRTS